MRAMLGRAIYLLFISIIPCSLFAQWVQTKGPYGGAIRSLAVKDSLLLAGTSKSGVMCSSDLGASWKTLGSGLKDTPISAIAIIGSNIFIGTDMNGIFLSTDNGQTWNPVNNGYPRANVMAFAVVGSHLFASANYGGGIFRTTDNGAHWAEVDSGIFPIPFVGSFAAQGSTIFASSDRGVYRTTDEGMHWTLSDSGFVYPIVGALAADSSTVYAASYRSIYSSIDAGVSWQAIEEGLTQNNISSILVRGSNLYVATNGIDFLHSTDRGKSWSVTKIGPEQPGVFCLTMVESLLFAGTLVGDGVIRSSDDGQSWYRANTGIIELPVIALAGDKLKLFAGTQLSNIYASEDLGNSWQEIGQGVTSYNLVSIAFRNVTMFAATFQNGIFSSTDYGAHWSAINNGITEPIDMEVFAFMATDSILLRAPMYGKVFRSFDNGANWEPSDRFTINGSIGSLASHGQILFAGCHGNNINVSDGMFRSTDHGHTWSPSGLRRNDISSIVTMGNIVFAATRDSGIFISTDDGTRWKTMNNGLIDLHIACLEVNGAVIFAATTGGEIFVSTNNGIEWQSAGMDLKGYRIRSLFVSGQYLFAGTWEQGLWRRPLSEIVTSIEDPRHTHIPVGFDLSQNYPNPFNPATVIRFTLPVSEQVTLKIYDMLGRVVATLVDGRLEAGYHEMEWAAPQLASGAYFYRITAGSFSYVKRMMLVR